MTRLSLTARLADRAISVYQVAFSGRPSPCRHIPSCSVYGREALAEHGAARGLWLTARRVGRCNPWGSHGLDPIPPRRTTRRGAASVPPVDPLVR